MRIVRHFPLSLPHFPARPPPTHRYFYCTAFGLGRALHHMQQLNAAESGGAQTLVDRDSRGIELRIGRLQRQKVRVSRKRILESAVKVCGLADQFAAGSTGAVAGCSLRHSGLYGGRG